MFNTQQISLYIVSALAVLVILSIHEFSHGYVAYKLGDPTAKYQGRLTLNPMKHIDPWGALCMVLFHFGWAKPVPIDLRYFKKPKRDFALVAIAGPISNLILALFGAFFYLGFEKLAMQIPIPNEFVYNLLFYSLYFLLAFHKINLGLAVFNLIPIPPLDGSRLLYAALPNKLYYKFLRYERTIYLIMIGWLFLGSILSRFLLSIPFIAEIPALSVIAKIFSLSGMISSVADWISELMLSLWRLLPFLR